MSERRANEPGLLSVRIVIPPTSQDAVAEALRQVEALESVCRPRRQWGSITCGLASLAAAVQASWLHANAVLLAGLGFVLLASMMNLDRPGSRAALSSATIGIVLVVAGGALGTLGHIPHGAGQ